MKVEERARRPPPVPEMPAVSASPLKPHGLKVALTFRLGGGPDAKEVLRPNLLQGITGDQDHFPANLSFKYREHL